MYHFILEYKSHEVAVGTCVKEWSGGSHNQLFDGAQAWQQRSGRERGASVGRQLQSCFMPFFASVVVNIFATGLEPMLPLSNSTCEVLKCY